MSSVYDGQASYSNYTGHSIHEQVKALSTQVLKFPSSSIDNAFIRNKPKITCHATVPLSDHSLMDLSLEGLVWSNVCQGSIRS